MYLKATKRNFYEFFSKAGKVMDVRLIMERNSRLSKGVGHIEFYDELYVLTENYMLGICILHDRNAA
jgi:RNA recognition motif-containing protein